MRIHPVMNISQIVQYKKQVEGQKKEEGKPIKVEEVKKWEVEKILNKRKIRGTKRYLLWQPLITKTNDHTNGKSLSWISSGEFTRELDKESLLN